MQRDRRAPVVLTVLFAATLTALPSVGGARRPDGIDRAVRLTATIEDNGVYGAGVLVDPAAGFLLTAHHVVKDMRRPRVTFSDGVSVFARVVDSDPRLDVALLQIPPQPARPAPKFGDAATLGAGEEVFAVGAPRRLGFTVSRGIVSFVGRIVDGVPYVQTDIPINEGNSGGPVVDEHGALVGIMSFIYRGAQGLSFAFPLPQARERFARFLRGTITSPAASPQAAVTSTAARPR
jgi:S1-C subfamily serine protease